MPRFSTNLFRDSKIERQANAFWDDEPLLFANAAQQTNSILNVLASKVGKKPRDLMAHLRRIYFCYQNALSEQLYAALLDLLIVVNGKGRRLCLRLIHGCHSCLDSAQIQALKSALNRPYEIPGNKYSLFTRGMVGTSGLVKVSQKPRQERHDFLKLAEDFIEFSQLEEAMSILEHGLDVEPERLDLQVALLELYKSTRSRDRFNKRYESIKAATVPLSEDWERLVEYFAENAI